MKANVSGGDLATREMARAAERQIAIVRLLVVGTNSLVYLFLMGGTASPFYLLIYLSVTAVADHEARGR